MIEIYKKFRKFRKKIKSNNLSIGAWMQIPSTEITDILSSNKKFDWVCVDLEHGNFDFEKLSDIFRIIQLNGKIPFARLKSNNIDQAQKVLDLGAMGLIIPKVEKSLDLDNLIRSTIYPPIGNRGHAFFRANLYGKYFREYNRYFQQPIILAMIETKRGLEAINQILEVKNLNGIFIGPYDLSASLNQTGNFSSKKFNSAISKIINLTNKRKKVIGIHVIENSKKNLELNKKKGFKFIAYSMDTVMLSKFD